MQEFQSDYSRGKVLPGGQGPIIALLVVFVIALVVLATRSRTLIRPVAAPRPVVARGELAQDEKSTIELFRQASPSVVYITTARLMQRTPFSLNVMEIPRGAGSGFVWDDDGHIVTNFHVIQGADLARVTFGDGSHTTAELVGTAPDRDLAVLKVRDWSTQLVPIPVGTSNDLEVGQKVFAIGNPFGFDQTLTTGVISGLGREIETPAQTRIHGVIQTDAAINPGNSGGPLLDSAGRLIGVNTAIVSPTGAYAGIGFAVPADTVNQTVPQLIQYGRAARPGLGIAWLPPHIQRRLGIRGVLVLSVQEGGAAEQAGIRPMTVDERGSRVGDIIVALDGKEVDSMDRLTAQLNEHSVGDQAVVTVLRDGQRVDIQVTLQALYDQ